MIGGAPNNHSPADITKSFNRFTEDVAKSIDTSLGVHIKPCRNVYHKPYHAYFDFMKAYDNWRILDLCKFSRENSK